ncbi:hypothetical protein EMGBD4_13560 [Verrucomicrobiota bacterium]|nr:hypothetical protein EMGBD4_13560 [Verrucomicrobiota bacterium]
MPPPESHRTVTAAQKDLLKRWIAEGANYQEHWTFIARPDPPAPPRHGERHPVDAFVAAKLNPSGSASRRKPPSDLAASREPST